jgi:hypothetical protein
MLRATHEARLAEQKSATEIATFRAVQAESQAEYWRRRAELFIDRAAAKVGITHEPVMREMNIPVDAYANNPFAGMGINLIDTTREDGRSKEA